MTSSSALRSLSQRQITPFPRPVDAPVPLRWREVVTLRAAIEQSLAEPDFGDFGGQAGSLDAPSGAVFLAAKTLLGLQPAYAVALVDQDGRLLFKETLRFSFRPAPAEPSAEAWPDPHTARRLERLGALLTDRTVYVPDELASDLDGLRQLLAQASRVQSLGPMVARRARVAGPEAEKALLDQVSRAFDAADDPATRARFVLGARRWAPPRARR
jgi:hypothetical protein